MFNNETIDVSLRQGNTQHTTTYNLITAWTDAYLCALMGQ